mmetsp:Transcript_37416/g.73639  ORF Transcript_37416/g.73639 Transcript_37416/m.73639 type:complete len:94 (-) Transcript_37416:337-618(-)
MPDLQGCTEREMGVLGRCSQKDSKRKPTRTHRQSLTRWDPKHKENLRFSFVFQIQFCAHVTRQRDRYTSRRHTLIEKESTLAAQCQYHTACCW